MTGGVIALIITVVVVGLLIFAYQLGEVKGEERHRQSDKECGS